MNFKNTIMIMLVSFMLISCAHNANDGHHDEKTEQPTVIEAGAPTIDSELTKITKLAYEQTLTESDFSALEALIANDETAKIDVMGMKALAKHQEFEHIQHTIGMLDRSLKAEGRLLCPAHDLGHYYVYSELGETDVAPHILERVKTDLHEWEEIAIEYDSKNPGALKYRESLDSVNLHLAQIDAGILTATPEEISALTGPLAICLTQSGEVEEHSHEEGEGHGDEHDVEEAHLENDSNEEDVHAG